MGSHVKMLLPVASSWLLLLLPLLTSGLDCQDGIIRGVNAGGWLLLEPWITPKLFEEVNVGENLDKIVDEYTYAEYVDPQFYQERLTRHWDTFVTFEDFERISLAGVTHVRIPVGYWYWDVEEGEPFPPPDKEETGPLFFLKRALYWLDYLGMKAEIDLHSGPGSQNGFDNSGRRGEVHWVDETYPENRHNVDRTLVIIDKIAGTMRKWIDENAFKEETLYGISLLNEPAGWNDNLWHACRDDFYPKGYDVIRKHFSEDSSVFVNLQMAFKPNSDYYGYMPESEGYHSVSLDNHIYQCFDSYWADQAERPEGWGNHLKEICKYHNEDNGRTLPTFTGEFSLAVTDCQKYLNGGFRTPYVPPLASESACNYYNSDFSTYPEEYKQFLREYLIAQMDAYEYGIHGAGWFMWTMKTEDQCAPEWDFIFLLDNGIAPENLCERPTYCEF